METFKYFKRWDLTPKEKLIVFRSMLRHQCFWSSPRYNFSAGFNGPFYGDVRKIISDPEVLKIIGKRLGRIMKDLDVDVIAACSTSGDAWGAAASLYSGIPVIILRKDFHYHGPKSVICGFPFKKDAKIALLEDSIGTSGQVQKFYNNLKKEGYKNITNVVCALDLCNVLPSAGYRDKFFRENKLALHYIFPINEYLDWLKADGYVSTEYHKILVDWFSDPVGWNGKKGNWTMFNRLEREGKIFFKEAADKIPSARL